jgi:transposase
MANVFWDRKGVLMVECMQKVTTITSEVYCKTLKNCAGPALQKKRRVMLLHDNERPHTVARTRALLEHFNCELNDHPPYSPDLAASGCHLFTYLKNWLRSQLFNNDAELMEGVEMWLSKQAADFFDPGIQNLFPDITSASIPAVTTFRSSLSMYFLY